MPLTDRNGKPLNKSFSKSFRDRADEGAYWESWVAAVLCRSGLYVLHNPFHLGEVPDPLKGLTADLMVGPLPDIMLDVEVKSRRLFFEDADSFSKRHAEKFTLCSQAWFLRNFPGYSTTGRDFLIVSQFTGSIVWVPYGTPVTFGECVDSQRGELFKAVDVETSYVRDVAEFVTQVEMLAHAESKGSGQDN